MRKPEIEQPRMRPDGFTRPADAAAFMGVSVATFWRWVRAGRAPSVSKLSPGVSAVRNCDLLAWAADPEGWAQRQQAEAA